MKTYFDTKKELENYITQTYGLTRTYLKELTYFANNDKTDTFFDNVKHHRYSIYANGIELEIYNYRKIHYVEEYKPYMTYTKFKLNYGINICHSHTAKMQGIHSLSTSPILNSYCTKRQNAKGSICQKCYSMRMNKAYKELKESLKNNHKQLDRLIPFSDLPIIKSDLFRFESFGDLYSENQIFNYFRICIKNPNVKFALWTKNTHLVQSALKRIRKPSNLQIITSSIFVNADMPKQYAWIDKIFTVYDKDFATTNNIKINCQKSCIACQKCYSRNNITDINELLK